MLKHEALRKRLQFIVTKYSKFSSELTALAGRVFCSRKIIIISDKGISSVPVSSKSQGITAIITLLIMLWISFSTGKYLTNKQIISQKDREIWNKNVTNESLQYQMADLHQNLADLNKYFDNIKQLDQLSQKSPVKSGTFAGAKDKSSSEKMADISKDKDAAKGGSNVDEVQQILFNIRSKVVGRISSLENIIGMTGLNLQKVAENNPAFRNAMINAPRAENDAAFDKKHQGGPYVSANSKEGAIFNQDEFESQISYLMQLEKVVSSIPLAAPLKDYKVTSPFGGRMDPIHGEAAIHTGIDIAGEYKSKVYSSAPGVVSFADMSGAYGRLVEIDHGSGISTRYGHLDRILVREGEVVKRGQLIGLQGNSGRSTGTHLHYEVRLNDQAINPANFLEAGKYVF